MASGGVNVYYHFCNHGHEDGVMALIEPECDHDIEEKMAAFVKEIAGFVKGEKKQISFTTQLPEPKETILLTPLPSRKIDLIGRQKDIHLLEERLRESNRLLLINGLGGIGKTDVCKRFFRVHYSDFAFAGWFDYLSSIKESLVNCIDWDSDAAKVYMAADEKDKPDVVARSTFTVTVLPAPPSASVMPSPPVSTRSAVNVASSPITTYEAFAGAPVPPAPTDGCSIVSWSWTRSPIAVLIAKLI